MNKYLLVSLFCVLMGHIGHAKEIWIKDFKSNMPLENVSVLNVRSADLDFSNSKGKVELTNYQSGDNILLSIVGYHDLVVTSEQLEKQADKTFYMLKKPVLIKAAQVTAFGRNESLSEVPRQIEVIGVEEMKFLNPQTSADALEASGKVLIQKSPQGGGSPVIRGFEANKILLVVDGVRMNNAIYRSGHLQNSITVDVNILEKAEIIFGPGSVVYGSDALGGVIHYRTKTPEISRSGKQEVSVNLSGRLSSVNQEKSSHFDFSIAEGRVASLTSFSVSDFGDLRMGTRRSHGDEQWGLVPEYVSTSGFQDFIIDNPDPTIQRGTGYQQMDFLQKLIYAPNDSLSFMVNFQFSTSSHVPRFDRLNDYRNGTLRWAEWSYGPQRRVLFSVGAKYQNRTAFFDELNVAAAVQDIEESRYKRLVNSTVRNAQIESVGVYSVNMDLVKQWKAKTQLNYGLEFVHNDVTSEATDRNLETLEVTSAFTRYPDEGSTMTTAAAYAMVKHELNKKFNLQAGTRYTLANLQSSYSNQEFFQLPFDEIQLSNGAFTGSLGLIWTPDSTIQVNAILASAFRIPNVDDFGKVRENGGFVIVPNDDLVPEQVYTAELNASKSFFENRFRIAAGGFYSIYNDALVARSGTLNGQDSLFIEGAMAKIEKNVNTNRAILYGGFAEVEVAIIAGFSAKGTVNYTYGQDVTDDIPLAHIPPVFGRASLEYLKEKFRGELFAQFNGAKDIDRYAPGVTDKAEEALETGTPSWYTINFSSSYYISKTLEAQFGVTNILDEHYKVFSSGPSAPGRNIYLGLRASF